MKNEVRFERNILVFLFVAVFFTIASSAYCACDPASGYFCNPLTTSDGTGTATFADIVFLIVQYLLSIVGLISLAMIIVGGFRYVTASGNEEGMASAKNTITSALTGLVLSLVAYGIVKGLEAMLQVQ